MSVTVRLWILLLALVIDSRNWKPVSCTASTEKTSEKDNVLPLLQPTIVVRVIKPLQKADRVTQNQIEDQGYTPAEKNDVSLQGAHGGSRLSYQTGNDLDDGSPENLETNDKNRDGEDGQLSDTAGDRHHDVQSVDNADKFDHRHDVQTADNTDSADDVQTVNSIDKFDHVSDVHTVDNTDKFDEGPDVETADNADKSFFTHALEEISTVARVALDYTSRLLDTSGDKKADKALTSKERKRKEHPIADQQHGEYKLNGDNGLSAENLHKTTRAGENEIETFQNNAGNGNNIKDLKTPYKLNESQASVFQNDQKRMDPSSPDELTTDTDDEDTVGSDNDARHVILENLETRNETDLSGQDSSVLEASDIDSDKSNFYFAQADMPEMAKQDTADTETDKLMATGRKMMPKSKANITDIEILSVLKETKRDRKTRKRKKSHRRPLKNRTAPKHRHQHELRNPADRTRNQDATSLKQHQKANETPHPRDKGYHGKHSHDKQRLVGEDKHRHHHYDLKYNGDDNKTVKDKNAPRPKDNQNINSLDMHHSDDARDSSKYSAAQNTMQKEEPDRKGWGWPFIGGQDDNEDDEDSLLFTDNGSGTSPAVLASSSSLPPSSTPTPTLSSTTRQMVPTTVSSPTGSKISSIATPTSSLSTTTFSHSTTAATTSQYKAFTSTAPFTTLEAVVGGRNNIYNGEYEPDFDVNSMPVTIPRVVIESDFQAKQLSYLASHYDTCDTCMAIPRGSTTQCPYYDKFALEFEKYAREYSDLLKYGCSKAGDMKDGRCCHTPNNFMNTAVQEIIKLMKTLAGVVKRQCSKCPTDCKWDEWSSWSQCPQNCLPEILYRKRSRSASKETYGGRPCHGDDSQRDVCPTIAQEQGIWESWTKWSRCTETCGGVQFRTRQCTEPTTCASCFIPCVGNSTEIRECGNRDQCCSPRAWAPWGMWTACTEVDGKTGQSFRTRWRSCEAHPLYKNEPMCPERCPGNEKEMDKCCTDAKWSEWGPWDTCSGSERRRDRETGQLCGDGCQNRTRVCIPGTCGHNNCTGSAKDSQLCALKPCCELPEWTQWGQWEACSVTVDRGIQQRRRYCQPHPDRWGTPTCKLGCDNQASSVEQRPCHRECPVCDPPRTWGNWGPWSECDYSLQPAGRVRRRSCIDMPTWDPKRSNSQCIGSPEESELCDCVPPTWGSWGSWSQCDYSVKPARRVRRRTCSNAATWDPKCSHLQCKGNSQEYKICKCAPPTWSSWGSWNDCDLSVRPVRRVRRRTCSNVWDPECSHLECSGSSQDFEDCNCERPFWTPWSSWSECDYQSFPPVRKRSRLCSLPRNPSSCPVENCRGASTDEDVCCGKQEWSEWGSWSACSYASRLPRRTRYRKCLDPLPGCPNKGCTGNRDRETFICPTTTLPPTTNTPPCDPGSWSAWGPWGVCVACVNGIGRQTRYRDKTHTSSYYKDRPLCLPLQEREQRTCRECTCVDTCIGRKDDNYASCKGCQHYINCCKAIVFDKSCQPGQAFDSICRKCVAAPSPTCPDGQFDIYLFATAPESTSRRC